MHGRNIDFFSVHKYIRNGYRKIVQLPRRQLDRYNTGSIFLRFKSRLHLRSKNFSLVSIVQSQHYIRRGCTDERRVLRMHFLHDMCLSNNGLGLFAESPLLFRLIWMNLKLNSQLSVCCTGNRSSNRVKFWRTWQRGINSRNHRSRKIARIYNPIPKGTSPAMTSRIRVTLIYIRRFRMNIGTNTTSGKN